MKKGATKMHYTTLDELSIPEKAQHIQDMLAQLEHTL
jgi:hypothetical protein